MNPTPILVNPMEENALNNQIIEPCAMVILGAHGDLTKRKLIPALYALFDQGLLPQEFAIVGMSRTQMTHDEFRKAMGESVQKYTPQITFIPSKWEQFASMLYYLPSNFSKEEGLTDLANLLSELEKRHGTKGNNIFYMATPPSLYDQIIDRLAESGLAVRHYGRKVPWPRVIVEKPFGRDLTSALELDEHLHKVFSESQIFRIDHYLGKETVQNIMVLRFANGIFEPLWNRNHIDHIQITNAETLGVEGRATYYEEAGNLRDMIQNHMLQLVALVAMEPPISLESEATRDEKAKVLKSIRAFDMSNLEKYAVRGQYGRGSVAGEVVPGYREEKNVSPESKTETFTALKLYIDNWRWAGVPFYVRSGKRLKKSITEIAIQFKCAPFHLFQGQCGDDVIGPNILVLQIQPDEGISLKFATKQPGPTTELKWLSMDFTYGSAFGANSPSAYERLVHDCILGDSALFARTDTVEASWRLITPLLDAWANDLAPKFPNYEAGGSGPAESEALINKDGRSWRPL